MTGVMVGMILLFLAICAVAAEGWRRLRRIEARQDLIFQRFLEAGVDFTTADELATEVAVPPRWVEYEDDPVTQTGIRTHTAAEPWT